MKYYVICREERQGPYSKSKAKELKDKWNKHNLIYDDEGKILSTGCNPHKIHTRIKTWLLTKLPR